MRVCYVLLWYPRFLGAPDPVTTTSIPLLPIITTPKSGGEGPIQVTLCVILSGEGKMSKGSFYFMITCSHYSILLIWAFYTKSRSF